MRDKESFRDYLLRMDREIASDLRDLLRDQAEIHEAMRAIGLTPMAAEERARPEPASAPQGQEKPIPKSKLASDPSLQNRRQMVLKALTEEDEFRFGATSNQLSDYFARRWDHHVEVRVLGPLLSAMRVSKQIRRVHGVWRLIEQEEPDVGASGSSQ